MNEREKQLSKAVFHALRHEPWLYELELDEKGWVDTEDLLSALRGQRLAWRDLTEADVRFIMFGRKSNYA